MVLAVCLVCIVILFKCGNNPVKKFFEKKKVEHAAVVAVNQMAEIKKHQFDSVTYFRDRYNQEHAQRELIQGNAQQVETFYKQKEDSLAKVLKIALKQIMGMYAAQSMVSGTFTAPVDLIPSFDASDGGLGGSPFVTGVSYTRHFTFSDSFLKEEGWVDSASARINYQIMVPVEITPYWKRKWLLGKKKYFVDGHSSNPNVHITGLTGISINH